ncbi:serine/threonine protein kinase [Nonomuraea soli]|uniref:Serine/threonine protein kinase n=1 Tax=Nonomuraea soli TaxID=1032476 RepID=A0A7W0CV10_9ACTN|nr:protein kinase [Nonomuraea soli]MBA2897644.1 serine/threonine protein kinase [Nonomuraea soli]
MRKTPKEMGPSGASEPDSLGGFVLGERIGAGRQAVVRLGTDATGNAAAVKLLRKERLADTTALEAFMNEEKALRAAPDSFTPRVYSAGWDGSRRYLACEYLPGPSLEQWIRSGGPLPPLELKEFALRFCRMVEALHERLIHHGDIKPRHVISGPARRLFLIDFGIARIGDDRLRRRDLFNAAAVLHYAAGGRFPYEGTPMEIASRTLAAEPDLRILPAPWRNIVGRCLNPNDRRRLTAADLVRAVSR